MGIVTYCQLAFIDIAGFSREALLGSADTIAEVGVAEGAVACRRRIASAVSSSGEQRDQFSLDARGLKQRGVGVST